MAPYCGEEYSLDIDGLVDAFCAVTWVIEYERIENPDRNKWQFWKKKFIFREIGEKNG